MVVADVVKAYDEQMCQDHLKQSFGDALRRARTGAGLTQRQLVDQLAEAGISVDQASIARMEGGKREPRLSEAIAIAREMGIDLSTIADQEINALRSLRLLAANLVVEQQARINREKRVRELMGQIDAILSEAPELKAELSEAHQRAIDFEDGDPWARPEFTRRPDFTDLEDGNP